MGVVFLSILIFFLTLLWYISLKRDKKAAIRDGTKLPPGSLGWPYIGETLQLYSQHPDFFFAAKQKRFEHFLFLFQSYEIS